MAREMKNSGIEWIGDIPAEWEMKRLKAIFLERKEKNDPQQTDFILSLGAAYGVVPYSEKEGGGNKAKEDLTAYRLAYPDDIVMNSMNIISGSVGISKYFGCVSPVYYMLYPRTEGVNQHYYCQMFQTKAFQRSLLGLGNGILMKETESGNFNTVRMRIPMEKLGVQLLPVPPYEEQKRIADFLDRKCAEIDTVIEKTKATIEEYKKLKQSVITEAVTKGIRGDRPMKDSGIEWIGDIPSEWNVRKILHCLDMPITDGPHTTPELFSDGVPFVSAEAVSCGNGRIDFSHIRGYISEEFYQECCLKYVPQIDDIYMIKSGATTGRVAIVDTDIKFNIWSPLAVFRCNKNVVLPMFMFYYLQSSGFQKQVEMGWSFGTQQNIGMRALEKLKAVIPSIEEQETIVNYLENKCPEIDKLIADKTHLLEEMESYKKSVIYEYVTGKKEVVL